jgi:hypothetical protein
MKYTAEYKGFTLNIEEVQEEGKDVCYQGKCEELKFINRQLYNSGFFRLIGKFKHEVDEHELKINYVKHGLKGISYLDVWSKELSGLTKE